MRWRRRAAQLDRHERTRYMYIHLSVGVAVWKLKSRLVKGRHSGETNYHRHTHGICSYMLAPVPIRLVNPIGVDRRRKRREESVQRSRAIGRTRKAKSREKRRGAPTQSSSRWPPS